MCIDPCFADSFTGKVLPDLPVFLRSDPQRSKTPGSENCSKVHPCKLCVNLRKPFLSAWYRLNSIPQGVIFLIHIKIIASQLFQLKVNLLRNHRKTNCQFIAVRYHCYLSAFT